MFNIHSPDGRFNDAFSAFACHTHTVETFINELAASDDPNDTWVQQRLAAEAGINLDRLTSNEIAYIEREVAKRL